MKTKFFISTILLAACIIVNAQTSKESANSRILNEFANKLDNYNIYVHSTALDANDSIFLEDGTYIVNPFQSAWCYFIDEMPTAGWVHPCKYYLVDNDSNQSVIFNRDIYPCNYDVYESVSTININDSPTWSGSPDLNYNISNNVAPNKKQWAILISSNDGSDLKRFWGDLSCVYTTLTNRFGFVENQYDTDETLKYFNQILVVAPSQV